MQKSKKLFLYIGLPLFGVYAFLIVIFYAFISFILLLPILILGVSILRKENLYIRLIKLVLGCYLVFFLLIPNPMYWPGEISKRMDLTRSSIITPDALCIKNLNSSQEFWSYLNNYTVYNETEFQKLEIEQKLTIIQDFILFKVSYSYDFNNYYVNLHTATPEQVLEKGKDDCQGQCVVMVSFLQYLGYDAWCAESPFHWYTRVFINSTYYIDLNKGDASEPLCIFNGKEVKFPTPFLECIYNVFIYRSSYVADFYIEMIQISPLLMWLILGFISIFITIFMISVLKYPRKYKINEWRKQIIIGSLFFYISLIIVYLIGLFISSLFILTTIILLLSYIILLDRKLL